MITGCGDWISEIFGSKQDLSRWIVIKACECGAYDTRRAPKSCECRAPEDAPVPTSYWPNLDWWAFGGVEKVVLCPKHKAEVADEIKLMRFQDASMNPTQRDPYNRH